MSKKSPVILALSGHDPSGGAGIQADIEVLGSLNCHTVSVITALTNQNTQNVFNIYPQEPQRISRQIETILDDVKIDAIKIGLLGHVETVFAVSESLERVSGIPVVLDPILVAGGGFSLSNYEIIEAMQEQLFNKTTILTPNSHEARSLSPGETDLDKIARRLMKFGCQHVLITGTHDSETNVINRFYSTKINRHSFEWPRLPHSYHGSGCTLAAGIAGYIGLGFEILEAVQYAQDYTWKSLNNCFRPGKGQHLPNRNVAPNFS